MKCLLKYQWVKLPRKMLPKSDGIMCYWEKLASRAAFRNGVAKYCGHSNEVAAGSWVGGIVGLKSILGITSRAMALIIMHQLEKLGYISYSLDPETKVLTYTITDWVAKCSGAACSEGPVYASEGYGFLCLPRNITDKLVRASYKFDDGDAWLDLWCHTVSEDPRNSFSFLAPVVQLGQYGAALTLENLGQRWGWEKTKVWRFLQKHEDAFTLCKLPSSYGCLIFNKFYPTESEIAIPSASEIIRILERIRILGENTYFQGTENQRINRFIAWYSKKSYLKTENDSPESALKDRVALSLYIYAYISQCRNCRNYIYDCKVTVSRESCNYSIRGPCARFGDRFPEMGELQ